MSKIIRIKRANVPARKVERAKVAKIVDANIKQIQFPEPVYARDRYTGQTFSFGVL